MVEVFKTNVEHGKHAERLVKVLSQQFSLFRVNFDLGDCDRILRVEGDNIVYEKIIEVITANGYQCKLLE